MKTKQPRVKTSKAVIKCARLNPINEAEEKALLIIDHLESKGYNFKQIVVDAINRAGGVTPEMFTKDEDRQTARMAKMLENALEQFGQELTEKLQEKLQAKVSPSGIFADDDEEGGSKSQFVRTFAKGFLQRQQSALGEDKDE
jgi:predicted transcriptional regulator